jgi:hypothetical protein
MRALLEPAAELHITPTEREIVILEKDGRLRTLHADGKKYKAEGGRAEVKTRWEGAELVVETRTATGGKATETFVVAPGERTLTITVRVEGTPMPDLTLKRVYRLKDASAE